LAEQGWCSRYSDCLRAGQPRGRSSSPGTVKNLLFSPSFQPSVGSTQIPVQCVPGVLSPGLNWQVPESDNSHPSSAKVKKMWIYATTPHISSWRNAQLVKHKDNFIFYLHFSIIFSSISWSLKSALRFSN
jgi:hypothetical protein